MPKRDYHPRRICSCGCGQTGNLKAKGYIEACHSRWLRAGQPNTGPPPPQKTKGKGRGRVSATSSDAARRYEWASHVTDEAAAGRKPAPPLTWRDRAACAGHPEPDLWVPLSGDVRVDARAARVCDWCPVATECLIAALLDAEETGVRAGLPESEVARLRGRYAAVRRQPAE